MLPQLRMVLLGLAGISLSPVVRPSTPIAVGTAQTSHSGTGQGKDFLGGEATPEVPYSRTAIPSPASGASPSETDEVSYESGPARYLDTQKVWQMTGGVKFSQNDTHLDTNAALVNLDKDMNAVSARSLSPVHMYDPDNDLTGDRGTIDFTRHLATLRDHITLIARPSTKPSSGSIKSQQKSPATLTCALMTYDYRKKQGAIPGPLIVHEQDRTLTADSATYDGVGKTVTLIGNVHVEQRSDSSSGGAQPQEGNELFADKVIAGVANDNQWILVPGPVHGKFHPKDDTNDTKSQSSPSAPPPPLDLPPDDADTGTATPLASGLPSNPGTTGANGPVSSGLGQPSNPSSNAGTASPAKN